MSKKTKTAKKTTDVDRDHMTREFKSGLALFHAYRAIPEGLTWGAADAETVLAKISVEVGRKYCDVDHAELWLRALRAGISGAINIPAEAKAATLEMVAQIEHEFFGSWIGAALITGMAAGLKGVGRDIIVSPTAGLATPKESGA
jgi:hypothetical protein